ncbi:MAG: rhodanese-like domain-containing protein, partial [Eggerthellaceae bacterium]|nr:rhodanese-like domain-containing protein [Eggerthellaceae bacterium]
TMLAALEEITGSKTGGDDTIVLVCYTGNRYAQAGTDILNALGVDMDNVYTLEGGMSAWNSDGGATTTD